MCQTSGVDESTPYQRMGGHRMFAELTERFYRGVADDPPLRALYPEQDLGPATERLRLFLEQYWGGPRTYQQVRGHPRLRIRHAPFAITPLMRDRWLSHMTTALDEVLDQPMPAADEVALRSYLVQAAQFLVNADDEAGSGTGPADGPASGASN